MKNINYFISILGSLVLLLSASSLLCQTLLRQLGPSLEYPWGMDFLNQNSVLVTEKTGKIFEINIETGESSEITGVPKVASNGQGGLLDLIIDQNKTKDGSTIYFCYSFQVSNGIGTAIDKAEIVDSEIVNLERLYQSNHISDSSKHFGCRLLLKGSYLFATLGDRGDRNLAQDKKIDSGSVIKISLQQWSVGKSKRKATVFSNGHRNPQGLALNPYTNQIWSHEHGPRGGDEINIIQENYNYGWPIITSGKEYFGGSIGIGSSSPDYASPIWTWIPSIAPSGMAFYNRNMFQDFKGHLLVGSLKFRSLYLVRLKDNLPTSETIIFKNKIGRIRDVAVVQDGSILILTDEKNGGLYKLFRK